MSSAIGPTRGQATVETVLGILVFVTVLVFGIHFAEITTLEMKVTEAAASAVWDSTSGQMHVVPFSYSQVNRSVSQARDSAQARYADFDGRSSRPGGSPPTQVFTKASDLKVSCGVGGGVPYSATLAMPFFWGIYRDNGGMWCSAEGRVQSFGASQIGSFLEGGNGFFQAKHKEGTALNTGTKVCAVNRPRGLNGPCVGRFGMLIDDWGLANSGQENGNCPALPYGIPCLTNINYWTAVMLAYEANSVIWNTQNGADANLIRGVFLASPSPSWSVLSSPTSFYMSFMGEDRGFLGFTPWSGDGSSWFWQSSPFYWMPTYAISYGQRHGCYLGKDCNTSTADRP